MPHTLVEWVEATTPGAGEPAGEHPDQASRVSVLNDAPVSDALPPGTLQEAYMLPVSTTSSMLQTIAIVDAFDDPTIETDLATFDNEYRLSACSSANGCLRKVNEFGEDTPLPPTEGFWATEISADVELSHALCERCRILLVEAENEEFTNLGQAVATAVAEGATEVNNSYESEGEEGAEAVSLNAAFYNHPGVVITASAGDCGYLGERCGGEWVSFPASSPDVVAVGATSLVESGADWASEVWDGTGGGCSRIFSAPAWQLASPRWSDTGCGYARLVSDVSADGAPASAVSIYDSTPLLPETTPLGWTAAAGTSVSAPIMTAEFALDGGSHGVAYPAETLYSHLRTRALYDVRSGANGSCSARRACEARDGYDGPSGVGSPVGLAAFGIRRTPANVVAPEVIGRPRLGDTLDATEGRWRRHPGLYMFQWARCGSVEGPCAPITGATQQRYDVTPADRNAFIGVQVTAVNFAGEGVPAFGIAKSPVGE